MFCNLFQFLRLDLKSTLKTSPKLTQCSGRNYTKYHTHKPGESSGEPAALTVMVLHSLSSPTEVISAGTEGAGILG